MNHPADTSHAVFSSGSSRCVVRVLLFICCAAFGIFTPVLATDCVEGNANCTCSTPGDPATCFCDPGYTGDLTICTDDDECALGTDNCDPNATCTNTPGSFTCACNPGYSGDGVTCTDDDECTLGTDNCNAYATCTNTPGGFSCACNPGYSGDGVLICVDDDECLLGTDNCDPNATCANTPGSFTCACNPGYSGDGVTCVDDDECALGTDNCDPNASCTNTVGSFTCACNPGYSGDGLTCTDIDECALPISVCDTTSIAPINCVNLPGSYSCVCGPGFVGDGDAACGQGGNPPCCATCGEVPPGLVSWWPADGDAQDVVGTNPGTLQGGAAFGPGRVGSGFTLDGLDDYVEVADAPSLELGDGDFSVAAWLRVSGDGWHDVLERRTGDGADYGVSIFGGDATTAAFVQACYSVAADASECWVAPVDLADGMLHQLSVVRDAAGADALSIYVDGLDVVASSAGVSPAAPANATTVLIGAAQETALGVDFDRAFAGTIDELLVFDRTLTGVELFDLFDADDGLCRQCTPIPANATGWWQGNGDAGDSVGGNPGSLANGTKFVAGKVGQAFSFDGVDDFVEVADAVNLRLEEVDFTVAAWVRLTDPTVEQVIVDKISGPGVDDRHSKGFVVHAVAGSGILRACWATPDLVALPPFGIRCEETDDPVVDGDWHHIALSRSGAGGTLYIDGLAASSSSLEIPVSAPAEVRDLPVSMRIGARHDGAGGANGEIDELALFRRAMTPIEIHDLAFATAGVCEGECALGENNCTCITDPCACTPGFVGNGTTCCLPAYDGIVAWWSGEDTAADSSGANDGTFDAATFADAHVRRGFELNGNDAFIDVADVPDLQLEAGDFSVVSWIKIDGSGSPRMFDLLDKMAGDDPVAIPVWAYSGYRVAILSGEESDDAFTGRGVVRACYSGPDLGGTGISGRRCFQGVTDVTDDRFHHVAVVKIGDEIKIYVDGSEEAMFVGFVAQPVDGGEGDGQLRTTSLRIGARHTGEAAFDGMIDELMIFDRVVVSSEIEALFEADRVGFCPDECADGTNTCDEGATCTDTLDGFSCECGPNYFGDGFVCTLLCDEDDPNCTCSTPNDPDTCRCDPGWVGEGPICRDRNECEEGGDNCSGVSTCINDPGTFHCECDEQSGFFDLSGDGTECSACLGYPTAGEAPVSHWPGDRTPEDAAGANPGTFDAATYQCTALNYGFELDGVNDRIEIGDVPELRLESGDFSISAWVRVDGAGQVDIVDKLSDAVSPEGLNWVKNGYNVTILSGTEPDEITAPGLVRVCYSTTSLGGRRCYQGRTNVADGKIHHIVVTARNPGSSDDIRIYVDGSDEAASFVQYIIFSPGADDRTSLWLGARKNGTSWLRGILDEVAVYDRELSQQDVAQIFFANAGICKNECAPGDPGCICNDFQCTCDTGWNFVIGGGCTDVDECELGIDTCSRDDLCFNTQGGFVCDNQNECIELSNPCSDADNVGALCTNLAPGFDCYCAPGFQSAGAPTGQNVDCLDVDECALNLDNCPADKPCVNVLGGFTCECPPGTHGDGLTCLDCIAPPSGLRSWWPFDGDARDAIGGNSANVIGSQPFPAGKVDRGFDMQNRGGWIDTPITTSQTPLDLHVHVSSSGNTFFGEVRQEIRYYADITAMAWLKAVPGNETFMFGRGATNDVGSFPLGGYTLRVQPNNEIRLCRSNQAAIFEIRYIFGLVFPWSSGAFMEAQCWDSPAVVNGQWQHIAATTASPQIFVNGASQPLAAQPLRVASFASNSYRLWLGWGNGILDETMLFDRARSPGEIQAIAAAGDGVCRDQCAPGAPFCTCDGVLCYCPTGFTFDGSTCNQGCTEGLPHCECDVPGDPSTCGCAEGYSSDGEAGCADVDECALNSDDCAGGATCGNTIGDYTCSCPDEFYNDGRTCFDCFPAADVVSWWPGDGQPNDVTNGNNGAFPADTYVDAMFDEGFAFDGFDDFLEVPDAPNLQREGVGMSISVWVKLNRSGEFDIVDKLGDASEGEIHAGYRLTVLSGTEGPLGRLRFCYAHPEIEGRRCFLGTTNIADGLFHHVVVTKDGVGDCDEVEIYVDGFGDDTIFLGTEPQPTDTTGSLRIGARHGGTAVFDGVIDELAILSRALTGGEVRTASLVADGLCRNECNPADPGCVCTEIECECLPGYLSSGGSCLDIDECDEVNPTHDCDSNATCSNTEGGFTCDCDPGYFDLSGDGRQCIDECVPGQAHCILEDGHYRCEPGYVGNRTICSDVDECEENLDNCPDPPLATCVNEEGSFHCVCNAGFVDTAGDGTFCEERWPAIGCGGGEDISVLDIVTATSGNVYITGWFKGLGLFGTQALAAETTDRALFVVKYDSTGAVQWSRRVVNTNGYYTEGRGIVVDEEENVYVVGVGTGDSVELVPGIPTDLRATNGTGAFVLSLDSVGGWRWSRAVTSAGDELVTAEAVAALLPEPAVGYTAATRIYLTGLAQATASFEGSTRTVVTGSWVATVDAQGNWDQIGGGETTVSTARRIAVTRPDPPTDPDARPFVYLTGNGRLGRFVFEDSGNLARSWDVALSGADGTQPYDVEVFAPNVFVGGPNFLGRFLDEGTTAGQQWESSGNAPDGTIRAISLVKSDDGPELFVAGTYSTLLEVTLQNGVVNFSGSTGDGDMFVARVSGANGGWLWANNATSETGMLSPTAISNSGAASQIAGVFEDAADFPSENNLIASCGTTDVSEVFVAQAEGSGGDWVSFSEFIVGQEVQPPVGAFTGNTIPPEVTVNGSSQNTAEFFFWSAPGANPDGKGRLYITRPAGAIEIRWPVDDNPANPDRQVKVGAAIFPTEVCTEIATGRPCMQIHVAGAPVEAEPPDGSRRVVRVVLPQGESSEANVENGIFNAQRAGWSVIEYALGNSTDTSQVPVDYEVVRTTEYRDLGAFGDDRLVVQEPCTIGKPLENTSIGERPFTDLHGQFTVAEGMRTGHVINESAFYDGVGPDAAYSRSNRAGTIIPVNRVRSERTEDADKALAVAWYRKSPRGVFWPSRAVEYSCEWPEDSEKIIIASQLGNELDGQTILDPLEFPQLRLYLQNDVDLAGYNPNDEHALIRPSNRDPSTGVDAIFALRSDFGSSLTPPDPAAPSDPYVLAKYVDPVTGRWALKIYHVEAFEWPLYQEMRIHQTVGEPIRPIYPMNLLPGCGDLTSVAGEQPNDLQPPVPFYRDHTGQLWARAAGTDGTPNTQGVVRFNYPLQASFYDDTRQAPDCVGFLSALPPAQFGNLGSDPVDTHYTIEWPDESPLLTVGETLMKQKRGLPNIMNQAATAVAYDEIQFKTLAQGLYDPRETLVRLFRPLTTITVPLSEERLNAAGLATDFAEQGKKSISGNSAGDLRLSPTMTRRLRYNPLARVCAPITVCSNNTVLACADDDECDDGGRCNVPAVDPSNCLDGALEFRGLFDDTLAGEPLLVPNILTDRERVGLKRLDGGAGTEESTDPPDFESCFPKKDTDPDSRACSWDQAIEALYHRSRNPDRLPLQAPDPALCLVVNADPPRIECETDVGWPGSDADGPAIGFQDGNGDRIVDPGRVLGTNAALTAGFARGTGKVVLVFNDDPSLTGLPVSLQVIDVGCLEFPPPPDPNPIVSTYQGQIHVIAPENVFDEQVTLRHSGDFAGRSDQVDFEWFIQADVDGRPPELGTCSFSTRVKCIVGEHCPFGESCIPAPGENLSDWMSAPSGPGISEITLGSDEFDLPPVRTLADNWFVVHYQLPEVDPDPTRAGDEFRVCSNPPYWSIFAGQPSTPLDPQGQLAEGWIKRVIKALNPFDARVRDFHRSPTNTIASAIAQAGGRFEGPIALNNDPENLNSIGLIEAYETVLRRALALSRGTNFPAAHNAILLISTRILDLYMLLGNDAFVDAQDPTIGIRTDSDAGSLAPAIFNFENQVASLLEEELILLRGRDDTQTNVVAPPVYNRFFWNFTTGQGEVAYAISYNISDINSDGFLDEFDARVLYPQGHGDAWGHYLTALKRHYDLLRLPDADFRWVPRPEAIRVAGVPVQVDFFDERKFARAAAAKAKVGAEMVDLTYRNEYVEDVEGQWQGYKDTDTDRAWGLTGWARRAGQGAYFDWLTGNAILPSKPGKCEAAPSLRCSADDDCGADAPCKIPSGIQRIDRTTVEELGEIVYGFEEIQAQLDEADAGLNPLGLAKGVVPFDIDPAEVDAGKTHFEQIYERAIGALNNTVETWNYANLLSRMLRNNEDSVEDLATNTNSTERDFKGRLIEMFGTPYPDDIGPGKTYPDGYDGPDLYHWQYIDLITLAGERLDQADLEIGGFADDGTTVAGGGTGKIKVFNSAYTPLPAGGFHPTGFGAFSLCPDSFDLSNALCPPAGAQKNVDYTLWDSPDFGLSPVKPPSWSGQRRVTGSVQMALQEIAISQLALKRAIREYDNFSRDLEGNFATLQSVFDIRADQVNITKVANATNTGFAVAIKAAKGAAAIAKKVAEDTHKLGKAISGCPPKFIIAGLAAGSDALRPVSCAIDTAAGTTSTVFSGIAVGANVVIEGLEVLQQEVSQQAAIQAKITDVEIELNALAREFETLSRREPILRAEMLQKAQAVQQSQEKFRNSLAEGQRTLESLVSFRKQTASTIQEFRYEDMGFRIFRTDALQKYRASFDLASRYAYLAAAAYDYDTNLLGTDVQAGQSFLRDIVRQRNLGQVISGEPVPGSRGLTDPLGRMQQNFAVLKGQMGFNNPQLETNRFSLREENFEPRLSEGFEDDAAWKEKLEAFVIDDIWDSDEFRRFARPFAPEPAPDCQPNTAIPCSEPAIVIPFDTTVTFALNFFGLPLEGGDSAYDPSNFSTRIRAAGVWFKGYPDDLLSQTPRVYLMPVGEDVLRAAEADNFETRQWFVVDQVLPVPFAIGEGDLAEDDWLPTDSLSGAFGEIRRFASMRAFPLNAVDDTFDPSQFVTDSRLIGRSVWNTRWVLIIPAGTLLNDREQGLQLFLDNVKDIQFFFQTYAYQGD